jgi:curved DNA-binding protein
MQNHYQTLGVNKDANADEIKRAYRRLASQHHPDKGGDVAKFQEIEQAYRTLSDPQARAQYDNPGFGGQRFGHPGNQGFDFQSIFDVFGARFHHPHQQRTQQARMSLWITLTDVAQGGTRTISIGTNSGNITAEIEIPLGINDGDAVQYPGIGPVGTDLIVTFRVHPDPRWVRQGLNLTTERAISVWDLILGTQIEAQDILKTALSITVPAGTQPGTLIRLRGKGLRARSGQTGDMFVRVQATIPTEIPADLVELIKSKYKK